MNQILDNYLFDAFASASDSIFVYVTDIKQDLTRWSKRAVDFFGLESEYLNNVMEVWTEHVHPDDREAFLTDINAVFTGESANHNCQYRARTRYGEYVWVECRGSIIYDSNGEAAVFAGIMTWLDNQNKYDSLTHLLTGYELLRKSFGESGSLMVVGVDRFRNINSQHGIIYGNKILVRLAQLLEEYAPGMVVYRFQGDEFAVYGKQKTQQEMAIIFKKTLAACNGNDVESGLVSFSISAGIVEFTAGDEAPDILGKAELSLAYAKENNSTHMAMYSSEIEEKQSRRNKISEELLRCIKDDFRGFHLVYQPILDNNGEMVVACESLLRWENDNPDIGPCYPNEFIPILESNGGIIEVGYYVMKESIRQAAEWQKKYKKFNVSFNVSYLQMEDPKFVPMIIETVGQYNMDTSCVVVELTESVLVADTVMVRNSFELLKKYGIQIALDDFGTGNSSFWMLHNINVDIIKLDQSFIRGLKDSGTDIDYAIVESVGLMCNRIGCQTVAEGVETDAIWKMISKFDFTGLQGYLFSRPVNVDEFEELLKKYHMER